MQIKNIYLIAGITKNTKIEEIRADLADNVLAINFVF